MSKWWCEWCGKNFKLKRELVTHLQEESEEGWMLVSSVDGQLADLGVIDE